MAVTETRIGAIELLCPDPGATNAFYIDAFGCRTSDAAGSILLGDQRLLFARATTSGPSAAPSNACAFQHCAIIVSDMGEAMTRLAAASGWSAISLAGPERLPEASGGATAFKFRDPDGHPLELLQFPPDAVPAAWCRAGDGPFLGIDHSAITVSDTDRAVAFWGRLGFRVTDRHVNEGREQARMDGLQTSNALVEVTTLMPEGGAPPHLELLAYRSPAPLPGPVPDGSTLATSLILHDAPAFDVGARDPDGHRFRIGRL